MVKQYKKVISLILIAIFIIVSILPTKVEAASSYRFDYITSNGDYRSVWPHGYTIKDGIDGFKNSYSNENQTYLMYLSYTGNSYIIKNGKVCYGVVSFRNKLYYTNGFGIITKDTGLKTYNGKSYYILSNYWSIYTFKEEPKSFNDPQVKISHNTPYLATGQRTINNKIYYFDNKTGEMVKNKTVNNLYYGSNGVLVNGWYKISGKWHYYKNGFEYIDKILTEKGYVYGFLPNGVMAQNGRYRIGGASYWFDSNGHAKKNTWYKNGSKYQFYGNSYYMIKSNWQKISGKWYYFDNNGYMLCNTSKKIGNKVYKFNASGVCTNP